MQTVLLHEHGAACLARLSADEVAALQDAGAGLEVRVTREPGVYELKANSFVGTVVLPSTLVRIRPKVSVERVVYLLGFGPEAMRFGGAAESAVADDLVSAMKHIYGRALTRALHGGLVRDYRVDRDRLTAVRGRVDYKALHLRRFGRFPPIDCSYLEYDTDHEANRRLLAAAVLLARAGLRSDPASDLLRRLCSRFENVELVRYAPSRLAPLRRTRMLDRYEPALSIAEAVLRNASLELPAGPTGAVAFVVDMNRVYETFVSEALAHELPRSVLVDTQPRGLSIDEGGRVPMIPDLLLLGPDGRPRVVADMKYKVVTRAKRVDIHQVVAYATALGVEDAVLIHPECPEETFVVRVSGVRVHQWQLSLAGSIADLREEVRRVARLLLGLYSRGRRGAEPSKGAPQPAA